ncbi:MAG: hypothetical protein H7A45_07120 [Verrucomicrobiales bacterium]|nr:hypothetical protein [Verrucomicrobiales bacterium]MCP5527403.1 hypothetical protein [Verrucomicrobiales bacterium]
MRRTRSSTGGWAGMLGGLVLIASAAQQPDGPRLAARFNQLTPTSEWREMPSVKLAFSTHHPQGMTVVGDRFFLSAVEVIDRARGAGRGHLIEAGFTGTLRRRLVLGEGPAYHPGGIDFDGERIWVAVAEYRPDSRSIVYTVDPDTLEAHRSFAFADHLGVLARVPGTRMLVGASWGSRRLYRWTLNGEGDAPDDPTQPETAANGSFYIDYQDAQTLPGTSLILFGGLNTYRRPQPATGTFALGGLELLDARDWSIRRQLPVERWSAGGRVMTQNPFCVRLVGERLLLHFIPDDQPSTLCTFEVK